MGLCKCPKRKVTNLFCFEHRVNVCEYCLTENHPRCVIQSYLNWLKDSDYNPNCALCGISLMEGEVVRLMCYDVFHLSCLEKHYKKLPPNTAPAGYKCYTCQAPIFPMPNQAGLVIDKMREALSKYNWARVGLGLPLFDEPVVDDEDEQVEDNFGIESSKEPLFENKSDYQKPIEPAVRPSLSTNNKVDTTKSLQHHVYNDDSIDSNFLDSPLSKYINDTSTSTLPSLNDSLADVDPLMGAVSRKLYGGNHGADYESYFIGEDVDGVDKYKRRSAFSWLSRWIKSRMLRGRGRETRALPRRGLVVVFFLFLLFFTLFIAGARLGRGSGDDPNFDPHHNPMVHVDEPRDAFVDMGGRVVDDPLLAVQAAAGGG